jgi:hypothetical protein
MKTVSFHTISRRLDEIGLFERVQETEHELTDFDLQHRLAFADQYLHWTAGQWAPVFFSDETHFYLGHHGRSSVRRPVRVSQDPKYMRQEKQLHGKASLWGCICAEELVHAELSAGSPRHCDILRHNLIASFRQLFSTVGPWGFQQDNVRFHTTPETVTYRHEKGVTLIKCPPWSPDLNTIVNLWNDLNGPCLLSLPLDIGGNGNCSSQRSGRPPTSNSSPACCRSMPRRLCGCQCMRARAQRLRPKGLPPR